MLTLYARAKDKLASLKRFFTRKEEGASLVEYGLLVGLIAVVCITVIATLGTQISTFFNAITEALKTHMPAP